MKPLFFVVSVIASIFGGQAMAVYIFGVTGPDEMTTACAVFIAAVIIAAYEMVTAKPKEAEAVKGKTAEEQREERRLTEGIIPFNEKEGKAFLRRYESYRKDFLEGRRDAAC